MFFVLRPQENFDFRIEVGRQIRQLGAQGKDIFVDIVVMRLQFHLKRFDIIAEAHVDAGAREVTVAAETDRRGEYCVRQRFLFQPGAEQMVVFVSGSPCRPGWKGWGTLKLSRGSFFTCAIAAVCEPNWAIAAAARAVEAVTSLKNALRV